MVSSYLTAGQCPCSTPVNAASSQRYVTEWMLLCNLCKIEHRYYYHHWAKTGTCNGYGTTLVIMWTRNNMIAHSSWASRFHFTVRVDVGFKIRCPPFQKLHWQKKKKKKKNSFTKLECTVWLWELFYPLHNLHLGIAFSLLTQSSFQNAFVHQDVCASPSVCNATLLWSSYVCKLPCSDVQRWQNYTNSILKYVQVSKRVLH